MTSTDPGAPLSTLDGKFKAVTVPKETDIGGRYAGCRIGLFSTFMCGTLLPSRAI